MPFITHRGATIHYEVEGTGPTVVLVHGFLSSGVMWEAGGYLEPLVAHHQVVRVDLIGHGQSDRPSDPDAYRLESQATDLTMALDAVGAERAHFVGYSMGGWGVMGVAQLQPERIASLVVGGFDPVRGGEALFEQAQRRTGIADGFDAMLGEAAAVNPALVEWISEDVRPGMRASFEASRKVDGLADAMRDFDGPRLVWGGDSDPIFQPVPAFAELHGIRTLAVSGDHGGALVREGREASISGLTGFLEETHEQP